MSVLFITNPEMERRNLIVHRFNSHNDKWPEHTQNGSRRKLSEKIDQRFSKFRKIKDRKIFQLKKFNFKQIFKSFKF